VSFAFFVRRFSTKNGVLDSAEFNIVVDIFSEADAACIYFQDFACS
jgi:hypothetical protein